MGGGVFAATTRSRKELAKVQAALAKERRDENRKTRHRRGKSKSKSKNKCKSKSKSKIQDPRPVTCASLSSAQCLEVARLSLWWQSDTVQ